MEHSFFCQGLTLSSMLECSVQSQLTAASNFWAQGILHLSLLSTGTTGTLHHTQLISVFFVEMGFCHVVQAGDGTFLSLFPTPQISSELNNRFIPYQEPSSLVASQKIGLSSKMKTVICLNPGGRGCSEPRLYHCTPAWVIEWDSFSKRKKKKH